MDSKYLWWPESPNHDMEVGMGVTWNALNTKITENKRRTLKRSSKLSYCTDIKFQGSYLGVRHRVYETWYYWSTVANKQFCVTQLYIKPKIARLQTNAGRTVCLSNIMDLYIFHNNTSSFKAGSSILSRREVKQHIFPCHPLKLLSIFLRENLQ